jgi:hypothetical protein
MTFLLGLVLGPALGVLVGDFLRRPALKNARANVAIVALVCLFVLFFNPIDLELRLGLLAGALLGLLLSATPEAVAPVD